MATVRISQDLKRMIMQGARNKMEPTTKRAAESFVTSKWGDFIYDNLFPAEEIAKAKALPSYWCNTIKELRVSYVAGAKIGLPLPLNAPAPWPMVGNVKNDRFTQLFGPSHTSGPLISLNADPVWDELEAAAVAYERNVKLAEERKEQFVDSVDKLLDTYTTLAPALKAWPALWELVPDEYKDRHKKVKEKVVKEAATPDVDLTAMTAVIAASKMLGQ